MSSMIDWRLAGGLARTVSGGDARVDLAADVAAAGAASRDLVTAYTRLAPGQALPDLEAVTRGDWVEMNLAGFKRLLGPLEDGLGARVDSMFPPLRSAAGLLLGAEVGLLTGYLSQRVLGQYDVALLEPTVDPRLVLVAPNLREAATRLEVAEEDLVRWVALHETTHAVQFAGVPWLRDRLGGLISGLIASADVKVDLRAALRMPSVEDLKGWASALKEGGLVALAAKPEQRQALDDIQATMALVEGYAEHVMDAVGEQLLPDVGSLRTALERRRSERSAVDRLVQRLIGLDLKLRQYREGKVFCDFVVEREGVERLNEAWASPEAAPTVQEIRDPAAWMSRTQVRELPPA
jgi:coenzyme F420 biosynthesis associated uncharacterized protein